MTNRWRGEVSVTINGAPQVMRLTLGALAELEEVLEADGLVALVERFETGTFRSRDVLALLLAGLRGGGWTGSAADLAKAEIEGGPLTAARKAAELITRAFAMPDDDAV